MARLDSSEKLKKLEGQKIKAEKRFKIFKQQQKAEEKKADSRRKVLIGEAVVQAVRDGKITEQLLGEILEQYITKDRDKEFLGLTTKSTNNG